MRLARPRSRQRGAALLTAMVVVTLVATLAAGMIWQQWRAVQVEIAERARVQAAWILSGALDWASLILREDLRSGGADHLGEPWAVPLAEARLSTFLAAERGAPAEDGPEAFLSGSITDAQSRYNLRNLVDAGRVVPAEVEGLKRLFQAIRVTPELADTIANALNSALLPPGSASAPSGPVPLLPETVDQIRWLGIDAESIARMAPYVVILPQRTAVNVNTAPKEVLVAAIDGLDLATAERLVQSRQRQPFRTIQDVQGQVPALKVVAQRANVVSSFFEVRGRLRLEDRVLEQSSLLERRGMQIVPLSRQRHSLRIGGA
ncbi:MAG TPA: type II secretion system minor pseudopilin GspK [Albitalea sp.]